MLTRRLSCPGRSGLRERGSATYSAEVALATQAGSARKQEKFHCVTLSCPGNGKILKRLVDSEDSSVVLKRYLLISVHEVFHMSRTIVVSCQG